MVFFKKNASYLNTKEDLDYRGKKGTGLYGSGGVSNLTHRDRKRKDDRFYLSRGKIHLSSSIRGSCLLDIIASTEDN